MVVFRSGLFFFAFLLAGGAWGQTMAMADRLDTLVDLRRRPEAYRQQRPVCLTPRGFGAYQDTP